MNLVRKMLEVVVLLITMHVTCIAQSDPFTSLLVPGKKVGLVMLSRITTLSFDNLTVDEGIARFIDVTEAPKLTPPKPGECITFNGAGLNGSYGFPFGDPGTLQVVSGSLFGRDLSAGSPLTVTGPRGTRAFRGNGPYWAALGSDLGSHTFLSQVLKDSLFLVKGDYEISAPGGKDIGGFKQTVTLGDPLQWTNGNAISSVNRSENLRITWAGRQPGDYLMILGVSGNVGFFCNASSAVDSFAVDSSYLKKLPASFGWFGGGVLAVGAVRQSAPFSAQNLDTGVVLSGNLVVKAVAYR